MIEKLKTRAAKPENVVLLHFLVLIVLLVPVIYFHNRFAGVIVFLAVIGWAGLLVTKVLLTSKLNRWPYWLIVAGPLGLTIAGNCLLMDLSLKEEDFEPAVIQHYNGSLDFLYNRYQPIGIVPLPGLTQVKYFPLRRRITASCPRPMLDYLMENSFKVKVSASLKVIPQLEAVRNLYVADVSDYQFTHLVVSAICSTVTSIFIEYPLSFDEDGAIRLSSPVAKEVLRRDGLDAKLERLGVVYEGPLTIRYIPKL